MTTKTIVMELEGWQIGRMLRIVNALKDFNRATDEKCDISYDIVQRLDYADESLGINLGFEQPMNEDGYKNRWSNFYMRDDLTKVPQKTDKS